MATRSMLFSILLLLEIYSISSEVCERLTRAARTDLDCKNERLIHSEGKYLPDKETQSDRFTAFKHFYTLELEGKKQLLVVLPTGGKAPKLGLVPDEPRVFGDEGASYFLFELPLQVDSLREKHSLRFFFRINQVFRDLLEALVTFRKQYEGRLPFLVSGNFLVDDASDVDSVVLLSVSTDDTLASRRSSRDTIAAAKAKEQASPAFLAKLLSLYKEITTRTKLRLLLGKDPTISQLMDLHTEVADFLFKEAKRGDPPTLQGLADKFKDFARRSRELYTKLQAEHPNDFQAFEAAAEKKDAVELDGGSFFKRFVSAHTKMIIVFATLFLTMIIGAAIVFCSKKPPKVRRQKTTTELLQV